MEIKKYLMFVGMAVLICMQGVVAQTEATSNPNVQAIDLRNHSSSAESRQNTYVVYKYFKPNFDHILYCWFGV